jgi:hypothetical protein
MRSTLDFAGDVAAEDVGREAPLDAGAVVVGVSEPDVDGGLPVPSGVCDPGSGDVTGVLCDPPVVWYGDASPTAQPLTAAISSAPPANARATRLTGPR